MRFYQKHKQLSMWIAAFIFVAAVILFRETLTSLPAIFSVIGSVLSILSPFFIGFIIAFVLFVPQKKFEALYKKAKRAPFICNHARGFAVLTVYIAALAVITVLLVLIIPWLVSSLISLYNNRTSIYDKVVDIINSHLDSDGKLFGFEPDSIYNMINPDKYLSDINLDKLTAVANGVYRFGTALVDILLAVFSSVYMLLSREMLVRSVGRFLSLFFKKRTLRSAYDYLCRISDIFYSYIYSALIDALIVAISCTVIFLIIGVDYAPIFGFLVGAANLIPYFGATISGIGVAVFTAITGGIGKALIVGASILILQQLDGNVIQPKIIGKNVGIHPLYTLIAITVGGGLLGFGGILIGVPIAATVQMIVSDIIERHEKREDAEESAQPQSDIGEADGTDQQDTQQQNE